MHVVVIRKTVVDKNPFVPTSLFNTLNEFRNLSLRRMKFAATNKYMIPFLSSDIEEINELFGGDPWPCGLEANRKALETLIYYLHEQAMVAQIIPLDQLFAPMHAQIIKYESV